jgi:hypothetical protein
MSVFGPAQFTGTIIFIGSAAITLSSSLGGNTQAFAYTPAELTASQAAQGFKIGQCWQTADSINVALASSGQSSSGCRFTLYTGDNFGPGRFITSRWAGEATVEAGNPGAISAAGLHDAVYVDRLIFDNMNPEGALPLNWFMDLKSSSGGFQVHDVPTESSLIPQDSQFLKQ